MDGNHPRRRKDKYNPYTIYQNEYGGCFLSFRDGQDVQKHFQIDKELYDLFDGFELEDLSYLNVVDRHLEQSELSDASLNGRAFQPAKSVEEIVLNHLRNEQLHRAISELPEIQRRRLILYYFMDLTYEQIATMESCTKRAVKFSIDIAISKLKEFL